jgi:hypothetical protein
MNKYVKNLAFNMLSNFNVHLTRPTDKQELLSLIKKLRPVTSGKELIRFGPMGDGGYLVPNDLEGIKACFSPGVDCVSGFEAECANRGMQVFLADKSVEQPAEAHGLFHFTKKYLGVTSNDDFMTLDAWVESSIPGSQDDLLLQIDIEGFEYEVFLAASDQLLNRFRIIVVEFHNLNELWNKPFFSLASRVFDKLLQTHSCVHNHPNNDHDTVTYKNIEIPYLTELTFFRKDRIVNPTFVDRFPHSLDCDNTDNPSVHLPECWYK